MRAAKQGSSHSGGVDVMRAAKQVKGRSGKVVVMQAAKQGRSRSDEVEVTRVTKQVQIRSSEIIMEAWENGVNPKGNSSNPSNWDFSSSFFFAGTVVTTIGMKGGDRVIAAEVTRTHHAVLLQEGDNFLGLRVFWRTPCEALIKSQR
ncbi:hypothetical protein NDU88_000922 [Pleurodeles waltl]|uniref:Uncharacterized protein n=1 Tax=Pleurodeles waltl TaxID=8319 RepID=A0AAV7R6B5_PLEWA|nr:hypothetical protein NDU88_000922 [Pleurodeles waltl]